MPAYIVKIRKPEEIHVNKSYFKIKVTKSNNGTKERDCPMDTTDHLNFKSVKRGNYIICGGKLNRTNRNGSKCLKFSNKSLSAPLLPLSINSNNIQNRDAGISDLDKFDSNNNSESVTKSSNENDSAVDSGIVKLETKYVGKKGLDILDSCLDKEQNSPKDKGMKIIKIIRHSSSSKVDDVIDEILNLEEGLDSGTKLKKEDKQPPPLITSEREKSSGTICELLGLNGGIMSEKLRGSPIGSPRVKKEPSSTPRDSHVIAFMKDRQKKDNHNMIERRRRFNINDRIRDLSQLLPKTNEPYHEIVRDIRHNKGQILRASVDYIQRLKSDLEMSKSVEEKRTTLELQNRQLLLRIQDLENQLRKNGIDVEESNLDPNLLVPSITHRDMMSTPTVTLSPTSSPYNTTTPQTSPFTATTSPYSLTDNTPSSINSMAGNFESAASSHTSDLSHINFDEDLTANQTDDRNLLTNFNIEDSSEDKKELLMSDFDSNAFGLNLMDDENLAFVSDPLFSSPQVSSPNSSRHSFDDVLTPESMDIAS